MNNNLDERLPVTGKNKKASRKLISNVKLQNKSTKILANNDGQFNQDEDPEEDKSQLI